MLKFLSVVLEQEEGFRSAVSVLRDGSTGATAGLAAEERALRAAREAVRRGVLCDSKVRGKIECRALPPFEVSGVPIHIEAERAGLGAVEENGWKWVYAYALLDQLWESHLTRCSDVTNKQHQLHTDNVSHTLCLLSCGPNSAAERETCWNALGRMRGGCAAAALAMKRGFGCATLRSVGGRLSGTETCCVRWRKGRDARTVCGITTATAMAVMAAMGSGAACAGWDVWWTLLWCAVCAVLWAVECALKQQQQQQEQQQEQEEKKTTATKKSVGAVCVSAGAGMAGRETGGPSARQCSGQREREREMLMP